MDALCALLDCALGFFPCYFLFGCNRLCIQRVVHQNHNTNERVPQGCCVACENAMVHACIIHKPCWHQTKRVGVELEFGSLASTCAQHLPWPSSNVALQKLWFGLTLHPKRSCTPATASKTGITCTTAVRMRVVPVLGCLGAVRVQEGGSP